jgi:hypothetical protein
MPPSTSVLLLDPPSPLPSALEEEAFAGGSKPPFTTLLLLRLSFSRVAEPAGVFVSLSLLMRTRGEEEEEEEDVVVPLILPWREARAG